MVPLELLSKIFISDNGDVAPEHRAQRKLNELRIPEIKDYILQRINTYVFKNPIEVMANISSVTEYIRAKIKSGGISAKRYVLHYSQNVTDGNYYINNDEDIDEHENFRKKTRFGSFHSKIKYKFGCDLNEELEFLRGFSDYKKAEDEVRFSRDDRKKMEELGVNIDEFSIENLKKQYKKLAKTCHPDLHPEDKEAEEKFKRLTSAYKKLLEKLS